MGVVSAQAARLGYADSLSPCLHGVKYFYLQSLPARWYIPRMDVQEMARLGGLARAKAMTDKQRRESALKASKAAAAARTKKARERKRKEKA